MQPCSQRRQLLDSFQVLAAHRIDGTRADCAVDPINVLVKLGGYGSDLDRLGV
jgi:hypothetical protein